MMSGRHVSSARPTGPRRSRLIIGLAVLVTVAAVASVVAVLVSQSGTSPSAASSSRSCTSGVALTVLAAPAIAPTVNDVASHWMSGSPVVDGACPTVVVRTSSSSTAEATLAKPDVTMPDVWIPDSSLWVQRLRDDTIGVDSPAQSLWIYPPVASSPLVLATTSGHATALAGPAGKGWASAMSAEGPISMVDPTTSTEGLLALLTTQSLVDGAADTPSHQLVSTFVGLSQSVLANTDAGFLALSKKQAQAFPASEQDVLAADMAAGNPTAVAVYPAGKSLSLDFPIVQVSPPGGDPARRDAAVAFIGQLSDGYAQQRMRTAGLRDAAGHPLAAADPSLGVAARTVSALGTPSSSHRGRWSARVDRRGPGEPHARRHRPIRVDVRDGRWRSVRRSNSRPPPRRRLSTSSRTRRRLVVGLLRRPHPDHGLEPARSARASRIARRWEDPTPGADRRAASLPS